MGSLRSMAWLKNYTRELRKPFAIFKFISLHVSNIYVRNFWKMAGDPYNNKEEIVYGFLALSIRKTKSEDHVDDAEAYIVDWLDYIFVVLCP